MTLAETNSQKTADRNHERALARRARRRSNAPSLPFDLLADSPFWPSLNSAEAGALALLAHAFWKGGGRELPSGDVNLAVIAKCHMNRWYGIKTRVLEAWNELLPVLRFGYSQLTEAHEARVAQARAASAAFVRKHHAKAASRADDNELTPSTVSIPVDQITDVRPGRLLAAKTKISNSVPENGAPKRVIRSQNSALIDKR